MTIGIDISQLAYSNVGVSNYLTSLVENMVLDNSHNFILLFSSRRAKIPLRIASLVDRDNVKLKRIRLTASVLKNLLARLMSLFLLTGRSLLLRVQKKLQFYMI